MLGHSVEVSAGPCDREDLVDVSWLAVLATDR